MEPAARAGSSGKEGRVAPDVFPLPRLRLPSAPDRAVSRPVRDRLKRRWAVNAKVNESVDALNTLARGRVEGVFRPRRGEIVDDAAAGRDVRRIEALRGLVLDVKRYQEETKEEMGGSSLEAYRALQAKHEVAAYAGGRADLAQYGEGPVSIPEAGTKGVDLCGMLPEAESKLLATEDSGLLIGKVEDVDTTALYGDPILYKDDSTWHAFVDMLLEAGLVVLEPGVGHESVRVFFVKKPDGKLRLIIDCRGVNAVCGTPPKTELGSVSALCDIAVPEEEEMHFSSTDLSD